MKEFNITGNCVSNIHYMVDITDKLVQIKKLIDGGKYFTINKARQFGKTTTRYALEEKINNEYLVINISFEGIGDLFFKDEVSFASEMFNIFADSFSFTNQDVERELRGYGENLNNLKSLSKAISRFCMEQSKKVVLIIDEVDKSSNNQLFLSFLGMLRDKYLAQKVKRDITFQSVILLGVYDIKNLKLKFFNDEEIKYNSHWNIATEFEVDMSFNQREIGTMLVEYEKDYKTGMNIDQISQEIYDYTNGYPYLVSKICKVIDEKLNRNWSVNGILEAVKIIVNKKNTLFDDMIKNLENNEELYKLVYEILIEGNKIAFNIYAPVMEIGTILGIIDKKGSFTAISNRIFEVCIYNYMISKRSLDKGELMTYEYRTQFVNNNKLNMDLVLNKFQEVMYAEYRQKDAKFIEREGRLLFLCFLKPVINGMGFYYVEAETREDNRMDIVVKYGNEEHVIELKIWHGENYENEALDQLVRYLESRREKRGYLISFSFNNQKGYTKEWKRHKGKDIYSIVV